MRGSAHARGGAVRRRRAGARLGVTLAAAAAVIGALLPGASAAQAAAPSTQITVDATGGGQVFDGVGALSAGASSRLLYDYPEPERSQILDYLFKPDYGASLQILKVEIGGDTNSTDGSESSHMHSRGDLDCNRGYEWWLMEQAVQRNPAIKLAGLAWGAPGWFQADNGQTDDFSRYYSQDNIDYQLAWLGCARSHGLHIDNVGIWNERAYDTGWIKRFRAALDSHGYGDVKIIAADDCCGSQWNIADDMAKDPALDNAVGIVGVHYPGSQSTPAARSLGKTLWASEDGPWSSNWGATGASASIPALLNRNYVTGRMTATEIWSPVTSYYDSLGIPGSGLFYANTPWSGAYSVRSAVWAVAQTTQFAQPGWRYIDSASGYLDPGDQGQGSYVTLRPPEGTPPGPEGTDYSTIIETMGASAARTVNVSLTGGASAGTVHVWRTDATNWFEHVADVTPQDGNFSLTVQPNSVYSITTTTGQYKGTAQGPAASAFPLPYHDNFEQTQAGQQPRYFSQQEGSFEGAPCGGGRAGGCVGQTVTQQPIRWCCGNDTPHGIIGDPSWSDYRVAADVRLSGPGTAELLGRTTMYTYGQENGYRLSVAADGTWQLTKHSGTSVTVLASGDAGFDAVGGWHHLALGLRGDELSAYLDGTRLALVHDTTYPTGQAGLGTGWNTAEFDNLTITPDSTPGSQLTASSLRPDPASIAAPGGSTTVSMDATNPGSLSATQVAASLSVPNGWTATPVAAGASKLGPGQTATWSWQLTAPADAAPGIYNVSATVSYKSGDQTGTVMTQGRVLLGVIPHADMTATATIDAGNYASWCCYARYAIDGDVSTMWHTPWSPPAPLPQSITLHLDGPYDVNGLSYQPRVDGNLNGTITSYTIYVSTDGTTFTKAASGTWAADPTAKTASFSARGVRAVRLEAEQGVSDWASAAEINLFGAPTGSG